jgi:hypothetical protein
MISFDVIAVMLVFTAAIAVASKRLSWLAKVHGILTAVVGVSVAVSFRTHRWQHFFDIFVPNMMVLWLLFSVLYVFVVIRWLLLRCRNSLPKV